MHSVTYGNIRYPKEIFTKIKKYIQMRNLFFKFEKNKQNIYDEDNGELINNFCNNIIKYLDKSKVFCNIHENKTKKILITGTSSGIGKSIALKLLKHNFTVIGISRTHTIKNSKYIFY